MAGEVRLKLYNGSDRPDVLWAIPGQTVWDAMASAGRDPGGECGGRGTCGKCRVKVVGEVSPLAGEEQRLLATGELREGYRLACYCRVFGETEVHCEETISEQASFPVPVGLPPDEIRPEVRAVAVTVPGPGQGCSEALPERLERAVPAYSLDLAAQDWDRIAKLDSGQELVLTGVAVGSRLIALREVCPPVLGVALDIGTTSLFAVLVDLDSGEERAVVSRANLQRVYGADVISRISYALQHPGGLRHLQMILINTLNSMLDEMVREARVAREDIFQVMAVGNPVMLHFLLGEQVDGFARAPFTGVFREGRVVEAGRLSLEIHPRGLLRLLPQVRAFVGADVVAGLLAIGPGYPDTFLFIDIGTNGEMVLHHRGQWWACSTAAGPAFEGGNITRGMRAEPGAIDRVWVQDGEIRFNVLGGGLPRGICGSGLVDMVAVLRDQGRVDATGCLQVTATGQGSELTIVEGSGTATGRPLVLTQDDLRQLQLAKGAIRAGVDIMLERAGVTARELERVFLAGAFGNCLHPESLLRIGLLPPLEAGRIVRVGNTAARGAVRALLSEPKREEAESLACRITYLELASQPDFQEVFLRNLNFGE